jgi:DNA-binding MarR family transcriptional regulator
MMSTQREDDEHLALSRSIERILSTIERCGLTPTEFRVLASLADDGCPLVELADRLDLPAATVRRASRQLTMRGLIRRYGGRRRMRVSLTASGLSTLRLLTATATTLPGQLPTPVDTTPVGSPRDPRIDASLTPNV